MLTPELRQLAQSMQPGNIPVVLFLGQAYLRSESTEDLFLSSAVRRFQGTLDSAQGYSSIFSCRWQGPNPPVLAWLDELRQKLDRPASLGVVAKYIWNAVFSSAIDSIWEEAFRDPKWRDTAQVFARDSSPGDPRNRTRLHCTYLYGCVNRHDDASRPPLTRRDLLVRRETATILGSRIPDAVTPLGQFLLDGYDCRTDWFRSSDLYAVVRRLPLGRSHLFGVSDLSRLDEDTLSLVEEKRLILHAPSLAQFFEAASSEGVVSLTRTISIATKSRVISFSNSSGDIRQEEMPRDVWTAVSRSARILDETILNHSQAISADKRYQELRTFLGSFDGRPYWPAFGRKLWFRRKFADDLIASVKKALDSRVLLDWPIILHGRSGSGKSVAMAALAYEIRSEARFPVLFIERKPQALVFTDVESFCHWCENAGAKATLIVWDGMNDVKLYTDLVGFLRGRGRRVVVVGSCYTLKSTKGAHQPRESVIRAPDELGIEEQEAFRKYLALFVDSGAVVTDRPTDKTFLVALYHKLPATRTPIGRGVNLAMRDDEDRLKALATAVAPSAKKMTALAAALLSLDLPPSENVFQGPSIDIEGDAFDRIQQLTGLITVPGQFGIHVPLELIVRAMESTSYEEFAGLLNGSDMFDWYSDESGQIFVGPRHSLEAKLIVDRRLPTPKSQVQFAQMLIGALRPSAMAEGSSEMEFAIQLLKVMGSTSNYRAVYAPYFHLLASSLRDLRDQKGVESPRLMLQEGNLLKESAIDRVQRDQGDTDVEFIFQEAEEVIRRALDVAEQYRGQSELRSMLNVELAAILRSRARQQTTNPSDRLRLLQDVRLFLNHARVLDPSNFYPLRVLFDSVRHSLDLKDFPSQDRAEAISDMLYTFQSARLDLFTIEQQNECAALHGEFLRQINHTGDLDSLTAELLQRNHPAGFYLKAYSLANWDQMRSSNRTVIPDFAALLRAEEFLTVGRKVAYGDIRCLDLLLDIWWFRRQSFLPFRDERRTCHFSSFEWTTLSELLDVAINTHQSHRQLDLLYLRGLCEFHVGAYRPAFETLKSVSRLSDEMHSRSRIQTWFLASHPDGTPLLFKGTVEHPNLDSDRGMAYVNGVNQMIPFFGSQFESRRFGAKESLPEFHIGFRFNGAIVDPVKNYRKPAPLPQ